MRWSLFGGRNDFMHRVPDRSNQKVGVVTGLGAVGENSP
jgi:hypothetical protein